MSQSRLSAIVISRKNGIKLEFTILFDPETEPIETLGTAWIKEGLTEAFWENCDAFNETCFESYGGFSISFELDGKRAEITDSFDVNAPMHELYNSLNSTLDCER